MRSANAVFVRQIYESDNGYMICCYENTDNHRRFNAAGYSIPKDLNIRLVLHGDWERNAKGLLFLVSSYEVQMPSDRRNIVGYLCSLRCGIGEKVADILYTRYKENIWNIIETQPELIKRTPGCRRVKVDKLVERYNETLAMRQLMSVMMCGQDISMARIQSLATKLGANAAEKVRENPYLICENGFDFALADRIAINCDFDRAKPERTAAAILRALVQGETQGHVFLTTNQLIESVGPIVYPNSQGLDISPQQIYATVRYLEDNGKVVIDGDAIYRYIRNKEERSIASDIVRLMSSAKPKTSKKLESYIRAYEQKEKITLDPQQKKAIFDSFSDCVHIITGGPGTGKTTILKAILYCHNRIATECAFEFAPLLMAPTGRAARKMTEATGHNASTIHSAMALFPDENGVFGTVDRSFKLDASIVIVDETSMLDSHIASILLSAIPSGVQLILVGDVDQLPSVGCGDVLREMINSGCIPLTRLNTIFRQAEGNPIIANSKKIRDGDTELQWAEDFFSIYARTPEQVYEKACSVYLKAVSAFGLDNVILLNPFRNKGIVSVNEFNRRLQAELNPGNAYDLEFKVGNTVFRKHDKVMQTKNTVSVANGDIGYIEEIYRASSENSSQPVLKCRIKFQDAELEYTRKEMNNVVLAYCTTVHKAQGSQYNTVIMALHWSQQIMLRRNLIYTGITRAVERAIIVSTPETVTQAITTNVIDKRNTNLGLRIQKERRNRVCR